MFHCADAHRNEWKTKLSCFLKFFLFPFEKKNSLDWIYLKLTWKGYLTFYIKVSHMLRLSDTQDRLECDIRTFSKLTTTLLSKPIFSSTFMDAKRDPRITWKGGTLFMYGPTNLHC